MANRRAISLIETLCALVLLAIVIAALGTWTRTVADARATLGPRIEAERAVGAFLRLIHDDVACGDLGESRSSEDRPRIDIDAAGRLTIATRDRGPVTRTYGFDPASRTVRLVERRGEASAERLMLEEIESWSVSIDRNERVLAITWENSLGPSTWRTTLR